MYKWIMTFAAVLGLALHAGAFELPNVAAYPPIGEVEESAQAAIGRHVGLKPEKVAAALKAVDLPWARAYVASDYSDEIEPGTAILSEQGGVWSVAAFEPNITHSELQTMGAPESLNFDRQPVLLAGTPDWTLDTTKRTFVGPVYALRYPNPATLWVVSPEEIAILGPRVTPSTENSEMQDGRIEGPEGDASQQAAAEPAYLVKVLVYPNTESYDAAAFLEAHAPNLSRMARPMGIAGDLGGLVVEAAPHGVRMRAVLVPAGQSMVCAAYPVEDVRNPDQQVKVGDAVAKSLRPLAKALKD